MDPLDLTGPGFSIDQQPFLGTVRLEALRYRNVDISKFYPYGDVSFP